MEYHLTHSSGWGLGWLARGRLKGTQEPLGETLEKNVWFLKEKYLNGKLLSKNHVAIMSDSPLHWEIKVKLISRFEKQELWLNHL